MNATKPSPTEIHAAKSAPSTDAEKPELDRRGKPLPLRQRVGGIITPQ